MLEYVLCCISFCFSWRHYITTNCFSWRHDITTNNKIRNIILLHELVCTYINDGKHNIFVGWLRHTWESKPNSQCRAVSATRIPTNRVAIPARRRVSTLVVGIPIAPFAFAASSLLSAVKMHGQRTAYFLLGASVNPQSYQSLRRIMSAPGDLSATKTFSSCLIALISVTSQWPRRLGMCMEERFVQVGWKRLSIARSEVTALIPRHKSLVPKENFAHISHLNHGLIAPNVGKEPRSKFAKSLELLSSVS